MPVDGRTFAWFITFLRWWTPVTWGDRPTVRGHICQQCLRHVQPFMEHGTMLGATTAQGAATRRLHSSLLSHSQAAYLPAVRAYVTACSGGATPPAHHPSPPTCLPTSAPSCLPLLPSYRLRSYRHAVILDVFCLLDDGPTANSVAHDYFYHGCCSISILLMVTRFARRGMRIFDIAHYFNTRTAHRSAPALAAARTTAITGFSRGYYWTTYTRYSVPSVWHALFRRYWHWVIATSHLIAPATYAAELPHTPCLPGVHVSALARAPALSFLLLPMRVTRCAFRAVELNLVAAPRANTVHWPFTYNPLHVARMTVRPL